VGIARWFNHYDERCQYGTVYDQIEDGDWPELSVDDFQIVNPMDEVVSVNPYSEDVDQDLFRMPSEGTGAAVVTT
jgi:hypothetical protein